MGSRVVEINYAGTAPLTSQAIDKIYDVIESYGFAIVDTSDRILEIDAESLNKTELKHIKEAATEVAHQWHILTSTSDTIERATATLELNNAISDLETWLPGYDSETQTMPWEREF